VSSLNTLKSERVVSTAVKPSFFSTHPVGGEETRVGIHQVPKIDLMWRLFNAFPGNEPRLEKTKAAAARIDFRRSYQTTLPERAKFVTTVDYYEAAIPLAIAQVRAIKSLKPSTYMRSVHQAIAAIFPLRRF